MGRRTLAARLPGWALRRYCLFLFLVRAGKGYFRNALANKIKRGLGRLPYFEPEEKVFGAWLRHRLGAPRPKVTSRGRMEEGAGSQARLSICAMIFARIMGFDYVHTPFHEIAHADRPRDLWLRGWEEEFNLGAGEHNVETSDAAQIIDFGDLYAPLMRAIGYLNFYPLFDSVAGELRQKYYLNRARQPQSVLTVAVHIRGGDVTKKTAPHLFTELSSIAATIRQLVDLFKEDGTAFRLQVFSQGGAAQLEALAAFSPELFVDADPFRTFEEMVEADVLVMGKGFFSYVAAILSDGVKLYDTWEFPALKGWIVRQAVGTFDGRAFRRALHASRARSALRARSGKV